MDSVTATYTRPEYAGPGSDHFVFHQFWVAIPDAFDIRSTLPHAEVAGVVQVAELNALWQTGADDSSVVLVWQDGQVAYRLDGEGLDLETLVRVALSLYE